MSHDEADRKNNTRHLLMAQGTKFFMQHKQDYSKCTFLLLLC